MASRRELMAMALRFERELADEFIKIIRSIRDRTKLSDLEAAIRSGDAGAVGRVLGIAEARMSELSEAARRVYVAGAGVGAVEVMRTARVANFSFNLRNPRVEAMLRDRSSALVTHIIEGQREVIRTALSNGMTLGQNPRSTALDIIGRKGASGRRTGGVIGLTPQQAGYVRNARSELSALDNRSLHAYLRREARDKRFDSTVIKATESGKPLTMAQIDKIAGAYEDRLLLRRGEDIARTEVMSSISAARDEAFGQAIDSGDLDPDDLEATWDSSGDARTRESHRKMDGQTVPRGGLFTTGNGYRLAHPGDHSHGAPASETVNCRCILTYKVDFVGRAAREAKYL